jgi:hypothetical protein
MGQALVCAHRGQPGDETLYWATNGGGGWSADTAFSNGAQSAAGPALAVLGGVLYCVHRGEQGDASLWWSTFDPASGTWSADQQFTNGNQTDAGPALCVFQGTLYCVHKGNSDNWMWFCSFDPASQTWSADQPFTNSNQTSCQPALFNMNDQAFFCVHKGNADNNLWWCQFTGDDWTADTQFSQGNQTCSAPGAAVFGGAAVCVHRGGPDENLWWCQWTGSDWTADQQIGEAVSAAGVGLAVMNGSLYAAHILGKDANLIGQSAGAANTYYNDYDTAGLAGGMVGAFVPVVGAAIIAGEIASAETATDDHLAWVQLNGGLTGSWSSDSAFGHGNSSSDTPALAVVDFP